MLRLNSVLQNYVEKRKEAVFMNEWFLDVLNTIMIYKETKQRQIAELCGFENVYYF